VSFQKRKNNIYRGRGEKRKRGGLKKEAKIYEDKR